MSDYPPEVQDLIAAALEWKDSMDDDGLERAVDAYRKATAPPEPFEAYVGYGGDDILDTPAVYDELDDFDSTRQSVWRCTVTPIERVRP